MSKSYYNEINLPILPNTSIPKPDNQAWLGGSPGWSLVAYKVPTQLEYFYDIKGAAQLTKVSQKTIRRAIQKGELKVGTFNKLIRIRLEDLLAWMGY
jgi:excisionase family DNA binding protein